MPHVSFVFAGIIGALAVLAGCGGGGGGGNGGRTLGSRTPETAAPAGLAATPARIDFGMVAAGRSATRDLTIRNVTTRPVVVAGARVGGGIFTAAGGPFPRTVAPGASLAIRVTYTSFVLGAHTASLAIDSDLGGPTLIALDGTTEIQPVDPLAPPAWPPAEPLAIERVNVDSGERPGLRGTTGRPAVSADGRYVAFVTDDRLDPRDADDHDDVYLRDRYRGTTVLVSEGELGEDAASAADPAISASGRFVAFTTASRLAARDGNAHEDVYVRDVLIGVVEVASAARTGSAGNGPSTAGSISDDGRFVAFESEATDLVADDRNGARDVFVRDLDAGVTVRASVSSAGAEATGGRSEGAAISGDARFVAFTSSATTLVAGDTNGGYDVFVAEWAAPTPSLRRVSVTTDGREAHGDSGHWPIYLRGAPAISGDGRYIAFASTAADLAPGGGSGAGVALYLRDRDADGDGLLDEPAEVRTTRLAKSAWEPAITRDGRVVVFTSRTDDIGADANGREDVAAHDVVAGTSAIVSCAPDGSQAGGDSDLAAVDATGSYVVFSSEGHDLVPGDAAGPGVFVAPVVQFQP